MIIRRVYTLLIFYLIFHGGAFEELKLRGIPSYAVIGPGTDSAAVLECSISESLTTSMNPHSFWLLEDATVLSYDNVSFKADTKPMSDYPARKFWLTLNKPRLSDERSYICQLSVKFDSSSKSYKSTVDLHVNQLPTVSFKQLRSNVIENQQSTVATCHAALSKPAVTMWFEDSNGEMVASQDSMTSKNCNNEVVNSSLSLTRTFTRTDIGESYYCVIKHPNRTQPYRLKLPPVNVHYPPSIPNSEPNSATTLPEGISFEMSCKAEGNPQPEVKWTFTPDVIANDNNQSNSVDSLATMPDNFIVTSGTDRLYSRSLRVAKNGLSTNNGTFTCTASNGVPPSVSQTFKLNVFALPPTTLPPTAPATTVGTSVAYNIFGIPEVTPAQQAGVLSAAVIAGVVAVAVFIILVTVILLLRYFMSHKGEYYTHELKQPVDAGSMESFDNEDGLPACEEDLLGAKKRKEHFL